MSNEKPDLTDEDVLNYLLDTELTPAQLRAKEEQDERKRKDNERMKQERERQRKEEARRKRIEHATQPVQRIKRSLRIPTPDEAKATGTSRLPNTGGVVGVRIFRMRKDTPIARSIERARAVGTGVVGWLEPVDVAKRADARLSAKGRVVQFVKDNAVKFEDVDTMSGDQFVAFAKANCPPSTDTHTDGCVTDLAQFAIAIYLARSSGKDDLVPNRAKPPCETESIPGISASFEVSVVLFQTVLREFSDRAHKEGLYPQQDGQFSCTVRYQGTMAHLYLDSSGRARNGGLVFQLQTSPQINEPISNLCKFILAKFRSF